MRSFFVSFVIALFIVCVSTIEQADAACWKLAHPNDVLDTPPSSWFQMNPALGAQNLTLNMCPDGTQYSRDAKACLDFTSATGVGLGKSCVSLSDCGSLATQQQQIDCIATTWPPYATDAPAKCLFKHRFAPTADLCVADKQCQQGKCDGGRCRLLTKGESCISGLQLNMPGAQGGTTGLPIVDGYCAKGLYCDVSMKQCMSKFHTEGQACYPQSLSRFGDGGSSCVQGLTCKNAGNGTFVCAKPAQDGDSCSTAADCAFEAQVQLPNSQMGFVCEQGMCHSALRSKGQYCNFTNAMCIDSTCDSGYCVPYHAQPLGARCESNAVCQLGSVCQGGVCTNVADCASDYDCGMEVSFGSRATYGLCMCSASRPQGHGKCASRCMEKLVDASNCVRQSCASGISAFLLYPFDKDSCAYKKCFTKYDAYYQCMTTAIQNVDPTYVLGHMMGYNSASSISISFAAVVVAALALVAQLLF